MTILSHPPITAVDLEQTQENFPSAVFLVDYTQATETGGSSLGTAPDIIGSRNFSYTTASSVTPPSVDIFAPAASAISGDVLIAPGTKPFVFFEIGIPGAGGLDLGATAVAANNGGMILQLTPTLYSNTAEKAATTNFGTGTQIQTRLIVVDFAALTMTPHQYRPGEVTPYQVHAATDLTATVTEMPYLTSQWARDSGLGRAWCMGYLVFDTLPTAAAIKAAITYMHHRAVDEGIVELPPFWSKR